MPKIETMYAFIYEEKPGDEGIIANKMGNLWMPLVGADMKMVDSLRPVAAGISRVLKHPVKLVKFTNRTEVEVIT